MAGVEWGALGREITEAVGGAGNVRTVNHCATRLRFQLRDRAAADRERLQSLPGVLSVVDASGELQVVIGNWIGFTVVALVLLPLYYRLQLTSIYDYLDRRFGVAAHKTGASFFILSRTLGATARLYLVVNVLHALVGAPAGIPFVVTTLVILLMIWLYTFQGGVKTIVFTDTLQTACMLGGLLVCVHFLVGAMGGDWSSVWRDLAASPMTTVWNHDVDAAGFWAKQVVGGAFIAIAMTGLDQEMMQKNISCKNIGEAQKNMITFSIIMALANLIFLILGGVLYLYADAKAIAHWLAAGAAR